MIRHALTILFATAAHAQTPEPKCDPMTYAQVAALIEAATADIVNGDRVVEQSKELYRIAACLRLAGERWRKLTSNPQEETDDRPRRRY